jgi:uncharacterized membrane protein
MQISKMSKRSTFTPQKLALSGLIMAIYIVVMYYTSSFAFGPYQVRIATSLYALSGIYPFLIIPLSLSNMLSNIIGGLGILDILGGLVVGLVTTSVAYLIKRFKLNDWFVAIPVILGPGLIVPIWLSAITKLPYSVLALSITIGQILPGILGVVLLKMLRSRIR